MYDEVITYDPRPILLQRLGATIDSRSVSASDDVA